MFHGKLDKQYYFEYTYQHGHWPQMGIHYIVHCTRMSSQDVYLI